MYECRCPTGHAKDGLLKSVNRKGKCRTMEDSKCVWDENKKKGKKISIIKCMQNTFFLFVCLEHLRIIFIHHMIMDKKEKIFLKSCVMHCKTTTTKDRNWQQFLRHFSRYTQRYRFWDVPRTKKEKKKQNSAVNRVIHALDKYKYNYINTHT